MQAVEDEVLVLPTDVLEQIHGTVRCLVADAGMASSMHGLHHHLERLGYRCFAAGWLQLTNILPCLVPVGMLLSIGTTATC
jgi:hypothetical protein